MSAADSSMATESAAEVGVGIPPQTMRGRFQRFRWPIMIGVVVIALLIGLIVYLSGGRYEATDDSSVQGARVNVAASISGRVVEVLVKDNQLGHKGDVLFRLDGRPSQTAYAQADAALASARAQVESMKATYRQ